jgi:hypothetical protein
MRLILLAFLLVAPPIAAQTGPTLPQIKSADGKHTVRVVPTTEVDDNGNRVDVRAPVAVPSTSTTLTVPTAETFVLALAANPARMGCLIQNKSTTSTMRVFHGTTAAATAARSIDVDPGDTYSCSSAAGLVVADQISIAMSVAGSSAVVVSQ